MNSALLETTILEAHTIKVPVVSATVATSCGTIKTKGASEYALLEYNNAVVVQVDYLLKLFAEKQDIERVREHIDRILSASKFKMRKANMCREILHRLEFDLRKVFDPIYRSDAHDFHQARAERAMVLLKEFRCSWLLELRPLVDKWEKNTQCYWVRQITGASMRSPKVVTPVCSRTTIRCGIVDFLKSRQADLVKIRAHILSLPATQQTDELKKLEQAIQLFLVDPESAAEYKTGCVVFADCLHALESKNYDAIYTMNKREFIPLCKALNQSCLMQDHHGNVPTLIP